MEKKMIFLTYGVYIGVALLIGYKMYTLDDGPTKVEILEALEKGAASAMPTPADGESS